MKTCSTCKQDLPIESFYNYKSGISNRCISCNKDYRKKYYRKHKKEENERSKEWYANNKEHKAQYYIDNIEHIKAYEEKNKEKRAKRNKIYVVEHKEACNRKNRAWRKRKWIEDPEYMINMYEILRTYTQVLHKEFLLDNLLDDLDIER